MALVIVSASSVGARVIGIDKVSVPALGGIVDRMTVGVSGTELQCAHSAAQ